MYLLYWGTPTQVNNVNFTFQILILNRLFNRIQIEKQ